MTKPTIPDHHWTPLSLDETVQLFKDAPFTWCIAGGYALELFVGAVYREHEDVDVVVYRDEQLAAQAWLTDWVLYAADPPGTLRTWYKDEFLPVGVHDIWGHKTGETTWQLQLMLAEIENGDWVSRHHSEIRFPREALIRVNNGIPCVRPEVQLLYKSRNRRPKDEIDFEHCLPLLTDEMKNWLKKHILLLFPAGHVWADRLS